MGRLAGSFFARAAFRLRDFLRRGQEKRGSQRCGFLIGGPRGADCAAQELNFFLHSGGISAVFFPEGIIQFTFLYFRDGDSVGFAGFGEGVAEELAFGGV